MIFFSDGQLYNDKIAPMQNTSRLSETDLCVMCGMCLPLCPTYQLYQTETESPRGRLALIQAINLQQIPADKKALSHIDHCLSCLNCETICPSKVPYGKLIDEFRDQFHSKIKKPLLSQFILKQTTKPNGLNYLASISNKPVIKQIIKLAAPSPGIPEHRPHPALKNFYPSTHSSHSASKGSISLFTGCTGSSYDYHSIVDGITLLNQLGYNVMLPKESLCCGALHQHNGQQSTAQKLLDANQKLFDNEKNDAILFLSPACGDSLKQLRGFNVQDIRVFILNALRQSPLKFSALSHPVALHESCSHRNRAKLNTLNIDLLNHIPGIEIFKSRTPSICCGAAGIQSINHPEQAQALVHGTLKSFDLSQTNLLISDNIGCTLHMKTAVSTYNKHLEIIHPVSLLARQLLSH